MIRNSRRLAGVAAEKLREMILADQLKTGEPLSEIALAEELGVSRTPVREAITLLESEGLVRVVPGKGAFVSEISIEDYKEINDLRICLEPLAATLAMDAIPAKELDEEVRIWTRYRDTVDRGEPLDSEEIARADGELHDLIAKHCNNGRLRQFLNILAIQRSRLVFIMWRSQKFNSDVIRQHLDILDCFKRRDADGLRRAMLAHMELNNRYVLEKLQGI